MSMVSGEALKSPRLLFSFFLLAFADLKSYKFTYWFSFPTVILPGTPPQLVADAVSISTVWSASAVTELTSAFDTWRKTVHPLDTICFAASKKGDVVRLVGLTHWGSLVDSSAEVSSL